MPDFERLTDKLRIFTASVSTREWARGYAAGKTRARLEVFAVVAVVYFAIVLVGLYSTA